MILCELLGESCKGIELKKGKVKEVYDIPRSDVLDFLKKKRKSVRGLLVNPAHFFYKSIQRIYKDVAKRIVDEEFPSLKDRVWQRYEDSKGHVHLVSVDGNEIEFAKEIIKASRVNCEILDLSAFNVTNFVLRFYEEIKNGVIVNLTKDTVYTVYIKNKKPFWGNSFSQEKFPEFLKKQINFIRSVTHIPEESFHIYLNVATKSWSKDIQSLKDSLNMDVVLIDPTGIAKNLRSVTEDIPSVYTALVGLSMRF